MWRQQQTPLQGRGASGHGVRLLFPSLRMSCAFFPEREKLEQGIFGSSTPSWGLLGSSGRGLGPQQGWGSARQVCSSTLVVSLGSRTGCFPLKKLSYSLSCCLSPPEPSLTATTPPSWQQPCRQESSANTHWHQWLLEGQRLARVRQCHSAEIPLSLPQPACHNAWGSARFPRWPRGAAPRSSGSWSPHSHPAHSCCSSSQRWPHCIPIIAG